MERSSRQSRDSPRSRAKGILGSIKCPWIPTDLPEALEESHVPSGTLELCLYSRGAELGERPSGRNGGASLGHPQTSPREEGDELWVIQCSSRALGLIPLFKGGAFLPTRLSR